MELQYLFFTSFLSISPNLTIFGMFWKEWLMDRSLLDLQQSLWFPLT